MKHFFRIKLLIAIWLSHGQRWAIIEGATSLTRCLTTAFVHFRPEGHREPCSEVGALHPAGRIVGLNREPSDSYYNFLNH